MGYKKEQFIKKLHEIDKGFSTGLAWEHIFEGNSRKVLMTPATVFWNLYKKEIKELQRENDRLRELLKEISKLSEQKQ